jgi:hypothetical protein
MLAWSGIRFFRVGWSGGGCGRQFHRSLDISKYENQLLSVERTTIRISVAGRMLPVRQAWTRELGNRQCR